MAKAITIEEFHATMRVPEGLREPEYCAIRRTLASRTFRKRLQGAVGRVLRGYPSLAQVKVVVSW
jgi:hypothetical protein